jgi:hypothetical protein
MSSTSDNRPTAKPGESKNAHFEDARQTAIMGAVFRGRRQDKLEYGGDNSDDFE